MHANAMFFIQHETDNINRETEKLHEARWCSAILLRNKEIFAMSKSVIHHLDSKFCLLCDRVF